MNPASSLGRPRVRRRRRADRFRDLVEPHRHEILAHSYWMLDPPHASGIGPT